MGTFDDLTGKTFGNWTVLGKGSVRNKKTYWTCVCSCEKHTIRDVYGYSLKRGVSTSCDCLKRRITSSIFSTHKQSNTRLYKIWKGMRKRCNNKNSVGYKNYGGRGIGICSEWDNFVNFYDWSIRNNYAESLTLDRINNDGNYEPSNCRWATMKQQSNNSRHNHYITINGVTKLLHEWSEHIGITPANVLARLSKGYSDDEMMLPSRSKRYVI